MQNAENDRIITKACHFQNNDLTSKQMQIKYRQIQNNTDGQCEFWDTFTLAPSPDGDLTPNVV